MPRVLTLARRTERRKLNEVARGKHVRAVTKGNAADGREQEEKEGPACGAERRGGSRKTGRPEFS